MRPIRFATLILVVTPILSACASVGRPRSAPLPGVPTIVNLLPTMTKAPYAQNFVWVAPSAIFVGITASDDSAGNWGPTERLKQSVAVPLAEMGWRESASDSANFRVSVLYVERTEIMNVLRWEPEPPPATRLPVPTREPATTPGSPDSPRPTPAPRPEQQPAQPVVRSYESRIPVVAQYRAFVIQRVSDGALFYRIVKGGDQRSAERTFARLVVQLIHQAPTP